VVPVDPKSSATLMMKMNLRDGTGVRNEAFPIIEP